MADHLNELVGRLRETHGENLKSVVLYGSAAATDDQNTNLPKNVLIVLDRITPQELKADHEIAAEWRRLGNPVPVYFTAREVAESSDVFPIEFLDMSRMRRVLYGPDPFDGLDIPTHNLRHQLEYELRGKLLRLRALYIEASDNPDRMARLMADSLGSFAVLFRHALSLFGADAPFSKRDAVMLLADRLKLDKKVFARIFEYDNDDGIWLQAETKELFAAYLIQIERVIEAVNQQ